VFRTEGTGAVVDIYFQNIVVGCRALSSSRMTIEGSHPKRRTDVRSFGHSLHAPGRGIANEVSADPYVRLATRQLLGPIGSGRLGRRFARGMTKGHCRDLTEESSLRGTTLQPQRRECARSSNQLMSSVAWAS
jgi:hypothetical protein